MFGPSTQAGGIMKKAVKRGKSKTKTKTKSKSKTKSKTAKSTSKRAAAKSKVRKTTKAKTARKAKKMTPRRAGTKIKHVAKKAATAAVVAAGLAALDTALGELNPKKSGSDASAPDKSEPKR
jgi:hypothetical protein